MYVSLKTVIFVAIKVTLFTKRATKALSIFCSPDWFSGLFIMLAESLRG